MTNQEKVEQFHRAFGLPVDAPWSVNLVDLREELIREEYEELIDSFRLVEFARNFRGEIPKELKADLLKELGDVLYVVYGAAVALGLNVDEAFDIIHKSNMSKLDDNGHPIYREDGKVLKGPNYQAPDLTSLVKG